MATTQKTEARYNPDVHSVGDARRWAAEWLAGHRLPAEVIDDVVLCLSEVLTNAVQNDRSKQPLHVRLSVLPDCVYVSVRDHNNQVPEPRIATDDDEGGRGLSVLAAFASAWGFLPFPGGKSVWFEVPRLERVRTHVPVSTA